MFQNWKKNSLGCHSNLVGYAKKVIKFLNHLITKNAHKTDKI